jgi:hypothetical protein
MTQPSYHPDCNPVEQLARQELLDDLYRRSGRDRKDHPLHSTYTGLWQEWTQTNQVP